MVLGRFQLRLSCTLVIRLCFCYAMRFLHIVFVQIFFMKKFLVKIFLKVSISQFKLSSLINMRTARSRPGCTLSCTCALLIVCRWFAFQLAATLRFIYDPFSDHFKILYATNTHKQNFKLYYRTSRSLCDLFL